MRPDEFHRLFHQGGHADSRFHVVREYEESGTCRDYTAMKRHTDTDTSHAQFGYTGLEESTAKVTAFECVCLLEEAVGFVGVGEVGRSHYHVFHLSSKSAEHSCRSGTGGDTCFLFDGIPVHFRSFAGEELGHFSCQFRICFGPFVLYGMLLGYDLFQIFSAFGIQFGHFGEDCKRFVRVTTQIFDGVDVGISTQRSTVCSTIGFIAASIGFACTFTHRCFTDDQGRAFTFCFCLFEGSADGIGVVTVDFDYFPIPCLVFHGYVFCCDIFCFSRKLDVVGVVEHDQIIQS